MSLTKGDHLRIQRSGKLVEPEAEVYHECEVLGSIDPKTHALLGYVAIKTADDTDGNLFYYHDVRIRIVK